MRNQIKSLIWIIAIIFGINTGIYAQQSPEELAKKLANPIANLISVPFQNNSDYGIGDNKGSRNTMNFQPVVPFTLSKNMTLITRYILPFVTQYHITAPGAKQSGLSDAVVSAFFSPANDKLTWGIGPVFLVPTATNEGLASKQFGVGPTAVVLKQKGAWTFGALVNQIWSVAGGENRPAVNQFFLQPFLTHNWKSGAGIGLASEITQNWTAKTTIAYVVPTISGVTKLGNQMVSLAVGPRWAIGPHNLRSDWGWRAVMILVFPK